MDVSVFDVPNQHPPRGFTAIAPLRLAQDVDVTSLKANVRCFPTAQKVAKRPSNILARPIKFLVDQHIHAPNRCSWLDPVE